MLSGSYAQQVAFRAALLLQGLDATKTGSPGASCAHVPSRGQGQQSTQEQCQALNPVSTLTGWDSLGTRLLWCLCFLTYKTGIETGLTSWSWIIKHQAL